VPVERKNQHRAVCRECNWKGPVRSGMGGLEQAYEDMGDHNEDEHRYEEVAEVE